MQADRQIPKAGWEVVRVGVNGGSGPSAVQQGWVDWAVRVRPFYPFVSLLMHTLRRLQRRGTG